MCTNGVNTNQLKATIEQIDETVALTRRWTHKLYHLAEYGGQAHTADVLKEVQSLLDEARALLTDANDAVDLDAKDSENAVRVTLV
ncbi:MAG: dynein gamma chain protein [Actinobacteria bacterium]|nr:dynein gamma chain protein [Actinomycetota bacterium]